MEKEDTDLVFLQKTLSGFVPELQPARAARTGNIHTLEFVGWSHLTLHIDMGRLDESAPIMPFRCRIRVGPYAGDRCGDLLNAHDLANLVARLREIGTSS